MNWFFVILCIVFAALFPDLPLLVQRLFGIISPNFYNIFRGFPSHLFQMVAVVLLLLYVFENIGTRRTAG